MQVFSQLLMVEQGRLGVVVTLIAVLELLKQSAIEVMQAHAYAPLYIHNRTTHLTQSQIETVEESMV